MKAFVIVGHGDFPVALKASAQMIIGKMDNLVAIPLLEEDGKDSYKKKIEHMMMELEDKYDSFIIFSDLVGGTPNNCVTELYEDSNNIDVIAGVNLPVVLTALTADLPQELLVDEGRNAIVSIFKETDETAVVEENQTPNAPKRAQSDEPYALKGVRVDARGIHGQVATAWIPNLQIDRVLVIDNNAVKDETLKSALKLAKPNRIRLSILTAEKAIERLSDPNSYPGENLLIILLDIETVNSLNNGNYYFDEIILGNVPNRENTERVSNTVHLLNNEKTILNEAMENGTNVFTQTVPNEKKYTVNQWN